MAAAKKKPGRPRKHPETDKPPAGNYWRKERKAREEREAKEAQEAGSAPKAPAKRGTNGVHLRLLEAIDMELDLLYQEPIAQSERQRRLMDMCSAAGKIQNKADLERQIAELEALAGKS